MVKVKVGHITVELIDGDRICSQIFRKGDFEPQSLAAWAKIVKPGKIAIDVGAYSGLYAIAAAKLGASHSIAFEPLPAMQVRIAQNTQQNKCFVALQPYALSSSDGTADLSYKKATPLTSGASLVMPNTDKIRVKVRKLDSFDYDDVAAIKIDVERNEPAVLRGARMTLERCRPALIIEALDDEMRNGVRAALPDFYQMVKTLDVRNLLFVPE